MTTRTVKICDKCKTEIIGETEGYVLRYTFEFAGNKRYIELCNRCYYLVKEQWGILIQYANGV